MRKLFREVLIVYLVFVVVFLFDSCNKTNENNMIKGKMIKEKSPEYKVIIPKNKEEILMKYEGAYVFDSRDIDLSNYSALTRKELFISLLLPSIDVVSKEVNWKKNRVLYLREEEKLSSEEETFLEDLYNSYKIEDKDIDKLISKMIMPPKSLIISQGALESGWGTSRFFEEGNNMFGIWSYDKSEPRIAAEGTRENGFKAHLKSYDSLKGSVEDYVLLISRNKAYKDLRSGIKAGEGSLQLAEYLGNYSELGDEYIKRVQRVITANDLMKYDE